MSQPLDNTRFLPNDDGPDLAYMADWYGVDVDELTDGMIHGFADEQAMFYAEQ